MVVRIFRPVTVIKEEQNELKFLIITKQNDHGNGTCLRHKTATVCLLFVLILFRILLRA